MTIENITVTESYSLHVVTHEIFFTDRTLLYLSRNPEKNVILYKRVKAFLTASEDVMET